MATKISFTINDILLLIMAVIWGFNFTIVKVLLKKFYPMCLNIIRLFPASVLIIFFLIFMKKNLYIEKKDWIRVVFLSFAGYTLYQIFFIHGINNTNASNAALIHAFVPIFTALISVLIGYEKLHYIAWIGIFLSFFGIFLILRADYAGFDFSSANFKGNILILLAVIGWASYTVIAKPLLKKYSSLKLTTITMAIGSIFLIPFSINELIKQNWDNISSINWLGLIYSTIFAIALGYIVWCRGVKKIGPSRTAIYSNLVPIFAVFFSWLFLSESLNLYHFLGAGVIFVGIYLTHVNKLLNHKDEPSQSK